jgi:xylulokinase
MSTLMGIDLGTTSLKVSIFSEKGELLASQSREYPILVPQDGYAEQDAQAWWEGFISACQTLSKEHAEAFSQVAGIGLCGQMHTSVLDEHDQILRTAITWMDQRSAGIVERIKQDAQARELIFRETSNDITTTYTAPQVKWVQENQPEVWKKVRHILVAKDFLKYKLTGVMATDYAEASGTLVFDVQKEAWSEEAFRFFGIPQPFFPVVLPSDEIIGKVSEEVSHLTGLKSGIPVVNGSSDNSASALGAGMVEPGQVTLIIGTAGVITVCSDKPLLDTYHRVLCWHYCLRRHWATLGIMQTAGESLEWFKNAFDQQEGPQQISGDIFNRYNQAAQSVPEGSDGLIFLPYLNGERTPYWDPSARGVFFGINLKTTKAHFVRAIMEGVSFALRNNIETVESLGIKINEVRAVGGGLKSPVWLEILGKILKRPIATVSVQDTANLGNILLCGHALGLYPSYEEAVAKMVSTDKMVNFPHGSDCYERQYPIFLGLYQQLKPLYEKAAE